MPENAEMPFNAFFRQACLSLVKEAQRRQPVITAVRPDALESVLREGLLSGHEMAKRPDLIAKARPDVADRKEWLKRYEAYKGDQYKSVAFSGPSVFFGKPDPAKVTAQHYINKWGGDFGQETKAAPVHIGSREHERKDIDYLSKL